MPKISERNKRIIIAALWCALIALCVIFKDRISVESIAQLASVNKRFVVPILLLLFAFKSITIVIYMGILYVASGILLPLPWAFAVNAAGTLIATIIPYAIGRRSGEPVIEHLTLKHPKLESIRRFNESNGFVLSLCLRLISVLPSDPLSMYLGAIKVAWGQYIAGSMLGFLPDLVIFTIVGKSVLEPRSPKFIAAVIIKLVLLVLSLIAAWLIKKRAQEHKSDEKNA